jgi:hypothetical protein
VKFEVTKPTTIDVKYVSISVAVRYDEDDMPNDFPFRIGDTWSIIVDIETGKIKDWPEVNWEEDFGLYMKVCDCGVYKLLDIDMFVLGETEGYVPHGVVPGEYGDYIHLIIEPDGTISNWKDKRDIRVREFFESDE